MSTYELHVSECTDYLRTLEPDSIDAVVTDPPYGLGFMGKQWDTPGSLVERKADKNHKSLKDYDSRQRDPSLDSARTKLSEGRKLQAWSEQWAREVYRVLKPGAYLVAFGGTRTYHRMASGLEDAGFEIRDSLCWLFGQGFPKSLDVSKAIDKAAGAEDNSGRPKQDTRPSTDAAKAWDGWGTALKPAYEPIVLARKPLIGTVAENVLTHGTGAINIDACRIAGADGNGHWSRDDGSDRTSRPGYDGGFTTGGEQNRLGRWPANVLLDDVAAGMLDEQSGELISGDNCVRSMEGYFGAGDVRHSGLGNAGDVQTTYGDRGGASRFFYCAKASRAERERDCEGLAQNGGRNNYHPTVKPVALMRWLVRLVTPLNGVVLDPFVGSGTTGVAALQEGCRFIGADQDEGYIAIARARVAPFGTPPSEGPIDLDALLT